MRSVVLWFTGLPSSGKSTYARKIHRHLQDEAIPCLFVDGDEVRGALRPAPGYSPEQRESFYQSLGNMAALFARQGVVVLVAATAHRRAFRQHARVQVTDFREVFMSVSLERAMAQDKNKGLYAAAATGSMGAALPGHGADYERTDPPDIVATGIEDAAATSTILAWVREARGRPTAPREVYVGLAFSAFPLVAEQVRVCRELKLDPRPELHLTLGFLGEATPEIVASVAERIRARLSKGPNVVRVTGYGGATASGPLASGDTTATEAVAWLAVEPDARVQELRDVTVQVLRELGQDKFIRAAFWPHITLGSRGPRRLWDRHDVPKRSDLHRYDAPLEVAFDRIHVTSVQAHPSSLAAIS